MRDFQIGNTIFHKGQVLTDRDILSKYNQLPLGSFADWIMPVDLYFKERGSELMAKIDAFFASETIYDQMTSDDLQRLKKIVKGFKKVVKRRNVEKFDAMFSQFIEIANKYIGSDQEV
jgi:hypothetical protein